MKSPAEETAVDPLLVEAGLARGALRATPSVSFIIAPLYVVFALAHPFMLPAAQARVMTPTAAASALVLVGLGGYMRRGGLRLARSAYGLESIIAIVVWINVTLHVAVSRELHQATNYALLAIGIGALLHSIRWYSALQLLTVASFVLALRTSTPSPLATHFTFLMVSALSMSIAIFVVRRLANVRIETLRLREAEQHRALEHLSARLQAVLDAMREGILVVDPDRQVRGTISRETARILGDAAREEVDVVELLYPDDPNGVERAAFESWLDAVFAESSSAWEELEGLAPRRAILRAGKPDARPIALEFRPMVESGRVAHVVVRVRDESDKQALERAMRAQQESFALRLAAMQRLVAGGGQAFVAFLRAARGRLGDARSLLAGAPSRSDLDEALEHVHSLKGEADAFELPALREAAHALEDAIVASRTGDASLPTARARADVVGQALAEAQALLVQASPLGDAVLTQTTVQGADVERLYALAGQRKDELGALARSMAARPFGELVGLLPSRIARWATSLGKRASVVVEGRSVLVPPSLADVLGSVLAHLARNAVVHGLELPDVRVDAAKLAHGRIELHCELAETGVRITFSDDGRGVPDALRDSIFAAGTSTHAEVDTLAGRGVGLSAARAELGRVGHRLRLVDTTPGASFVIDAIDAIG